MYCASKFNFFNDLNYVVLLIIAFITLFHFHLLGKWENNVNIMNHLSKYSTLLKSNLWYTFSNFWLYWHLIFRCPSNHMRLLCLNYKTKQNAWIDFIIGVSVFFFTGKHFYFNWIKHLFGSYIHIFEKKYNFASSSDLINMQVSDSDLFIFFEGSWGIRH